MLQSDQTGPAETGWFYPVPPAAILILNQYPVSMSLKQMVLETNGSARLDVARQCSQSLSHALEELHSEHGIGRRSSVFKCSMIAGIQEASGFLYCYARAGAENVQNRGTILEKLGRFSLGRR